MDLVLDSNAKSKAAQLLGIRGGVRETVSTFLPFQPEICSEDKNVSSIH
jgi:hypothetical protein